MPNKTCCPIFPVSNVNGTGITLLKNFIAKLPNIDIADENETTDSQYDELIESEFVIDSHYNPKGVGLVLGGTITKGEICLN